MLKCLPLLIWRLDEGQIYYINFEFLKGGGMNMKEFIQEYGGVIVTVAVILILIAVVVAAGQSSFVQGLFTQLLDDFTTNAQSAAGF